MGFGSGLVPRTLEAIFNALSEESMRWMMLPSVLRRRLAILSLRWTGSGPRSLTRSVLPLSTRLSQKASRCPMPTFDVRSVQVAPLKIHNERIRDLLAPATPKEAPAWQDRKPFHFENSCWQKRERERERERENERDRRERERERAMFL